MVQRQSRSHLVKWKRDERSCRVESDRGSPCRKGGERAVESSLRVTNKTRIRRTRRKHVSWMYFRSFVQSVHLRSRLSFTLQRYELSDQWYRRELTVPSSRSKIARISRLTEIRKTVSRTRGYDGYSREAIGLKGEKYRLASKHA